MLSFNHSLKRSTMVAPRVYNSASSMGRLFSTTPTLVAPSNLRPTLCVRSVFHNPSRSIAITAMPCGPDFATRHPPPAPGADFNVVMVGAGVSLI